MFPDIIHWYADHAATIFTVLVASAIALELLGRWADGRLDPGERTSVMTSLSSGLAFVVVKSAVGKLAVTALALFVYDQLRLTTLDLTGPWVWAGVFVARRGPYGTPSRRRPEGADDHPTGRCSARKAIVLAHATWAADSFQNIGFRWLSNA